MNQEFIILFVVMAVAVIAIGKTVLLQLYLKIAVGRTTWLLRALGAKLTGSKNSIFPVGYGRNIGIRNAVYGSEGGRYGGKRVARETI